MKTANASVARKRHHFLFFSVVSAMLTMGTSVQAQTTNTSAANKQQVDFAILTQPLATAIVKYRDTE